MPALQFSTSSGRTVFWRGESVGVSLRAVITGMSAVTVTLQTPGGQSVAIYEGALAPQEGIASLHLLLPTKLLGDGVYQVSARVGEQSRDLQVTLRETTVASPGMIIDDRCGGPALAPNAALAGQTGFVSFMTDGSPVNMTGERVGGDRTTLDRIFDEFMDQQILYWAHDASRPFSFYPPYVSPRTQGEYARRLVVGNTALMRYPCFAGQIFDYDPVGFLGHFAGLRTYWQWGKLEKELGEYLAAKEEALFEQFRRESGQEPLVGADAMRLAAALRSPEGMGYIDLPTRRWAEQIAARSIPPGADDLEALRRRGSAWYETLMTLNRRRYTEYLGPLRSLDPTLRHSTANTINHCSPRNGGNHPLSYEPLDFRFVSVWDDQGGAPEHIYETVLAATLLGGNRDPRQPLWIDTVFGWLNGNHFRNVVLLAGRGAQGAGYSSEMGGNLVSNGREYLLANSPRNQEIALNARLMRDFGPVFARSRAVTRIGLLYSDRQCMVTPYAQSYCDGWFKVMYLLAHAAPAPRLVTESILARGEVSDLAILVVVGQSEELPAAAKAGLEKFAAKGGRVVADSATSVDWPFLERSTALDLPFRDLGHPYNTATAYNRQDATVGALRDLAAERCPRLRALLQTALLSIPVDCPNPDLALTYLEGGAAAFLGVVNDSLLDFDKLFLPTQKSGAGYQQLFVGHGIGAIGSWMPMSADLLLSPATSPRMAIYDLLEHRQIEPKWKGGAQVIACDLSRVPARMLALYPHPVGRGQLQARQEVPAGTDITLAYQAITDSGENLPAVVPIELTLRAPDGSIRRQVYRATDTSGRLVEVLPTTLDDASRRYVLEARQLLDGRGVSLPIRITAAGPLRAVSVHGASVRDPQAVRLFLRDKPELLVPVFDPAVRPLAEKAVAGLTRLGVKARLWESPPLVEYHLGYVVRDEQKPANEQVDRGQAFGKVQFQNHVHHINGNFYGSAIPGFRFGKHVLLLGTPGTNPVLDGLSASGLLWSDRATESPGAALVQRLPWALGLEAETIAVLGADPAGLAAGIEALLKLPEQDAVTEGVRLARSRLMQGRSLPRERETVESRIKLTTDGTRELRPWSELEQPRFSLTPVVRVEELGDDLVVGLGRYGSAAAVVDRQGNVTPIPNVTTTGTLACGPTLIVTATPRMTFAWTRNAQPAWRALGDFKAVLPGTDDVIVESGGERYRISPDGSNEPFAGELPSAEPKPIYVTDVVLENDRPAVGRVIDTRSNQPIEGFALAVTPTGPHGSPAVENTLLAGKSGDTLLVFRRYVGENGAQLYRKATGRVTRLTLETGYLTDAAISASEKLVALCGLEGDVVVMDLEGKEISRSRSGAFPRVFPLSDGGFAVGSADGLFALIAPDGKERFTRDLLLATSFRQPSDLYRLSRNTKLLSWSNPPAAPGDVPLDVFYLYLRDADGTLKMINWSPAKTLDFRWMDAVQGEVKIPESRPYAVTVRAAAKYFDQQPLDQPSWEKILAMRAQVVKDERPAPLFRVYVDGKLAGALAPEGGALKPFAPTRGDKPWANLNPKDEEHTIFTGKVDLPAGPHLLGLEAVHMEDCLVQSVTVD